MRSLLLVSILFVAISSFAQDKSRMLCVLDMQDRNNETNDSRIFSCIQMVNVAGVPAILTSDFDEALNFGVILFSSEFKSNSFSFEELEALENFVEEGGVIISSRIDDDEYYELFGISKAIDSKNRYLLNFEIEEDAALFHSMDEEFEKSISLGRADGQDVFKTVSYETTSAKTFAKYDDGSAGFIGNKYGNGTVYSFGFSWKEIVTSSQINRDYEAQRISSNGFEATQDVLFFLIRNIFSKHVPYTAWKHTSPRNSSSTLIVTHDLDSKTGVDSMMVFANQERDRGISATYNITTRYFDDYTMGSYYTDNEAAVDYVMDKGHTISSHSVGHFFDFADSDIFPIGEKGLTQENYTPFNDGERTTGGTVYGECEVSKNILEENHDVNIRCFRAGHLAYNNHLIDVLDTLGYEFNSSFSSADILTNFPFQCKYGRSFSGKISNVSEMPVTISDVFHADPMTSTNFESKVEIWKNVFDQNDRNGAVTTLLIHPNRIWKNNAQNKFLDQLPSSTNIMEMTKFGDYWNQRKEVLFSSTLVGSQLTLKLENERSSENEEISFVVSKGQELSDIVVLDYLGNVLNFDQDDWKENDVIVFIQIPTVSSISDLVSIPETDVILFPNPTQELLYIQSSVKVIEVNVFNVLGQLLDVSFQKEDALVRFNRDDEPGVYFVVLKLKNGHEVVRQLTKN